MWMCLVSQVHIVTIHIGIQFLIFLQLQGCLLQRAGTHVQPGIGMVRAIPNLTYSMHARPRDERVEHVNV
jgi:hypothetical protein